MSVTSIIKVNRSLIFKETAIKKKLWWLPMSKVKSFNQITFLGSYIFISKWVCKIKERSLLLSTSNAGLISAFLLQLKTKYLALFKLA